MVNHQAWISEVQPHYDRLTRAIVPLLEGQLRAQSVEYLSVTGRTKTALSIIEKIDRKKYETPESQVTDICGIRVVTFLEEQASAVTTIVKELFEVDEANSLDRSSLLGLDRIGYRSTHFVCSIGSRRRGLPEYAGLGALKFEIQVRTVLQHAWAELAHDRSFKFRIALPHHLQRKLNLYSGMLEIVDQGFNDIAKEIDTYSDIIVRASGNEFDDAEIDEISLKRFFLETAREYGLSLDKAVAGSRPLGSILHEIRAFGITTIGELKALVTPEVASLHKRYIRSESNRGFIRTLLMFNDIDKYMSTWGDGVSRFAAIRQNDIDMLSKRYERSHVMSLLNKHNVKVLPSVETS